MKLQSYLLGVEQIKNMKLHERLRHEKRSRDGSLDNKKLSTVAKASRSDLKTMISRTKQIENDCKQAAIEKENMMKDTKFLKTDLTQQKNQTKDLNSTI